MATLVEVLDKVKELCKNNREEHREIMKHLMSLNTRTTKLEMKWKLLMMIIPVLSGGIGWIIGLVV